MLSYKPSHCNVLLSLDIYASSNLLRLAVLTVFLFIVRQIVNEGDGLHTDVKFLLFGVF